MQNAERRMQNRPIERLIISTLNSIVVMAFLLVVTVLAVVIDANGMESMCVAITTHAVKLGQLLVLTTAGTMAASLLVGVTIALKPSLIFVAGITHYI